jgi:hypothetical protein
VRRDFNAELGERFGGSDGRFRRESHAKQHKGSREQYERMLALWRDGTLRRVLEAVE